MIYLIFLLIGIGVVAALFGLYSSHSGKGEEPIHQVSNSCTTCSGFDSKCEQECLMEASTKEIEYFDDEELDRFKGKPSEQYTDEEVAEFAEVLNTMQQKEVKDWNRSLILRGINLPNQLKDQVIMLIADAE